MAFFLDKNIIYQYQYQYQSSVGFAHSFCLFLADYLQLWKKGRIFAT